MASNGTSIPKPWRHCVSSTLRFPTSDRDFRGSESDFRCFLLIYHKKKTLLKQQSRSWAPVRNGVPPSWICIPQKSLAVARDFWNTNSLKWIPFRTGAHDGVSISWDVLVNIKLVSPGYLVFYNTAWHQRKLTTLELPNLVTQTVLFGPTPLVMTPMERNILTGLSLAGRKPRISPVSTI